MNWIRVAVNIGDDPRIDEMAAVLKVRAPEVVGLVVLVLAKLPANAPDGDLSSFRDSKLEQWANWHGKAGAFGVAFRAMMCEADVVRAWDKHNGKALERAERAAERVREWRRVRETEREQEADKKLDEARTRTRNTTRNVHTVKCRTERNVTRRNETELLLTTNSIPATADAAPAPERRKRPRLESAAQWPAFTQEHCGRLRELWKAKLGSVDYARFRKAFGDLYGTPEAGRAKGAPTNAELDDALEHWLLSVVRGQSSPFAKPETCAAQLSAVANVARGWGDNFAGRFNAIDTVVHGRPLPKSA